MKTSQSSAVTGGLFKKKPKYAVGLDIGSSRIKFVSLGINPKTKGFSVQRCGVAKLAGATAQELRQALEKCVKDGLILAHSEVAFTVPGTNAVVRYVTMPKMKPEELRKAISFELEKYITFSPKDAVYDFQIVQDDVADEKKTKILLIVARKDEIDSYARAIAEAKLSPKIASIAPVVLKTAFYTNYSDTEKRNIALVDIGLKSTTVNIVRSGISNFIRDIAFGGDDVTTMVAEKLEVSRAEAEGLKVQSSDDPVFKESLKGIYGNFVSELSLSFDYYESQFESGIDGIFISGASSYLPDLLEFMKQSFSVSVERFDPFVKLTIEQAAQEQVKDVPSQFAIAVGLALEHSL